MEDKNSITYPLLLSKSNKSTRDNENHKRQDFWNGTLVDDYNFLMSEELICRCKGSFGEPFTSLNDLSVHHVSYNEFEKQYGELFDWCEKIYETITKISLNALTRYLRQKYYEELYEQGLMRLRMFNQYADKLIERFPDLKLNINDKMIRINQQWNSLESRFIDYLDEDFDRILQDLHNELLLFEEWLSNTEEQLWTFELIRSDDISLEDFQYKLHQHTKLQDEIKSRNSRVSSIIEICERLINDYEQQSEQVPFDLASDLESRWHQTWINSVEIQCKLEERLKFLKNSTPRILIDKEEEETEEDDIIPFNSSEYEKIPLTPSNSSIDSLNSPINIRKRPRSPLILNLNNTNQSKSFYLKRKMARSKQRMSLNLLPINSPSTFYYSLTNINDFDDKIITKKQKRTLSKLDVGYESEDEKNLQPIFKIKKSQSDYLIEQKLNNKNIFSSLTHSLPILEHNHHLPTWWRHSITSAYDTCSNPDIDLSLEETKKSQTKTSLLMYSKKYTKFKRIKSFSQQQSLLSPPISNIKQKKLPSNPTSNSYDASAEYTDPEQSENDVDLLSSDFNSTSPVHHYQNSESQFYNRYTTTTTGYSSDIELETTTTPSETEDQQTPHLGEVSQMKIDTLPLSSLVTSDEFNSLNTIIINEKIESSEPCWDGYQNPLFYPLNSQDMDSIETTLKWEDQFLEMDQPNNSSSDDEIHLNDNFIYFLRNNDGSSSSLTGGVAGFGGNRQVLDSDSDLDDFNYVVNETERQLYKARQSLEKKKRQQPSALNDRNLRKYDEVLRTCETNIQCLQQILKNLHRSKNSRLNSTKAIEQLQKADDHKIGTMTIPLTIALRRQTFSLTSCLQHQNDAYLSGWHDMRQQVNDDRIRARQLLYVSQEIIKLKLRLDEELSYIDSIHNHNHPWLDDSSLAELLRRIDYEIESEKEARQKSASYRADILLAEDHLNEYRMSHLDGPLSSNIDEHLHSCRLALEQLTDKMDTYQTQLHTLSSMINNLLPIETQIEQKLTSFEYNNNYQIDLPDIQRLIDKYEQIMINLNRSMIPINNLQIKIKSHCESKLDLYKKILNDLFRKSQSKHVSFDGSSNLNNNNSSIYQSYLHDINQSSKKKNYRRTETHTTSDDIDHDSFLYNTSNKQNSTTSYISDDCKVLYIETVIEVDKPVFYERTNDTLTTKNTEYHHHHNQQIPQRTLNTEYHQQIPQSKINTQRSLNTEYHQQIPQSTINTQRSLNTEYHQQIPQSTKRSLNTEYHRQIPQSTINTQRSSNTEYHHQIPQSKINTQRSTNKFYMSNKQIHESSDDDSNKPVNLTSTTSISKNQLDSGIEYDQTSPPTSSSSSTIFNQRTLNNKLLIPPITTNSVLDETSSQSKLIRRSHSKKSQSITKDNIDLNTPINSYWNRLKQTWLRSLLIGLLILFILFFVYFSRLDTCSRSTIIRAVFRKIICIEHEGIPTL